MRVLVIAPMGAMIPGHGSRGKGEYFDLPSELAADLVKNYPDQYQLESPAGGRMSKPKPPETGEDSEGTK